MYGYIYITTNTVNDKKYIGKHRSPVFDASYHGSGFLLKKAMDKYGEDKFKTELLQECSSLAELNLQEQQLIEKYDAVNREDFYNLLSGGDGGDTVSTLSPERNERRSAAIAASRVGSKVMHKDDTQVFVRANDITAYLNEGYVFGRLRKCNVSAEGIERRRAGLLKYYESHEGHMKGKQLTAEQREKISVSSTGRSVSSETRAKISEANKGRTVSEEHRAKMSLQRKGVPKSEEHRRNIGLAHKGKPKSEETKKKLSDAIKGRVWVNNGSVQKQIPQGELDHYIDNGFTRGCLKRHSKEGD